MKVVSIKEPFATLIKEKKKYIETRSWKTNYRGELYIHASGKTLAKEFINEKVLKLIENLDMNYGKIICKANLVDCVLMDKDFIYKIQKNPQEYYCGLYEEGRYAWILENIEPIAPIEAKGKLNIWNYDIEESNRVK